MSDRFANTAAQFPDFDLATLPAIPAGFEDVSWHNDACPSFLNESAGLILFVNYLEPENREFPDCPRFIVMVWDLGTNDETVVESDDFAAVLPALISVTDEATSRNFLNALFTAGLAYHPDDSAADCLSDKGLSVRYLRTIQRNVTATFAFVDPSAIILDLINA